MERGERLRSGFGEGGAERKATAGGQFLLGVEAFWDHPGNGVIFIIPAVVRMSEPLLSCGENVVCQKTLSLVCQKTFLLIQQFLSMVRHGGFLVYALF